MRGEKSRKNKKVNSVFILFKNWAHSDPLNKYLPQNMTILESIEIR